MIVKLIESKDNTGCPLDWENKAVFTVGQCCETGTCRSYHFSDCPEQYIPDIDMYSIPANVRDLHLKSEYLSKHFGPTNQYLQYVNVAKLGQVCPTPLSTILGNLFQISTCTQFQLTLETYSFDLSTLPSTLTQLINTYNKSMLRNWDKWVLPL